MFSQVKNNGNALERIRGYQGEIQNHPRKMKVCQIERTKKKKKNIYIYIYMKLSTSQYNSKTNSNQKSKEETKQKKELARLKTQKGSLSKN